MQDNKSKIKKIAASEQKFQMSYKYKTENKNLREKIILERIGKIKRINHT